MRNVSLSVVFVVGERRDRISHMLNALSNQTISEQLEVVLVDTTGMPISAHNSLAYPVKHIRTVKGTLPGRARYQGFVETSAMNIAFLEDHCYPESGWAESLVQRQQEPWAAVGYVFKNGSPDTYFYRSALLAEYGHWLFPYVDGPTIRLPGCNVSFKREALERFGEELPDLLEMDYNLHQALLHRGSSFYIEPHAVVHHECYLHLRELLVSHFLFCRLQADRRIKAFRWSWKRRLLYGCLSPILLPPLQALRFMKAHLHDRSLLKVVMALPVIFSIYQFDAVGEAVGCFAGSGNCEEWFSEHEMNALRAEKRASSFMGDSLQ